MGFPSTLLHLMMLTVGWQMAVVYSGFQERDGPVSQTPSTGTFFNCHRPNVVCDHGTCNDDGLGCTCDDGYENVLDIHCLHQASSQECTADESDALACQNGGVCRRDEGVPTCYCTQLYLGTTCGSPRMEVVCNANSMTVFVKPFRDASRTFHGKIYAKGKADDANCDLEYSDFGYTAEFSFTESDSTSCGIQQKDLGDSNYDYVLKLMVIYGSSTDIFITVTDQELTATCSYSTTTDVSSNIFETTGQNVLDQGSASDSGAPAELKVLDGSDSEIPEGGSVNIGDDLKISVSLLNNPTYTGMKLGLCTASNTEDETDDDHIEIILVEATGCPSASSVVSGNHQFVTPTPLRPQSAIHVPFKAFMFSKGSDGDNSNDLFIKCDISVCNAADNAAGNCDPPSTADCTNTYRTGLGRKKRSSEEDSVTLSKKLTVRFGKQAESGVRSDQIGMETDTGKCLKNPEMQTVISVLGVLLLALIIVLTFIVCRRARYSGKEVDDSHTMGSSTQTLSNHEHRMHIPRPDY